MGGGVMAKMNIDITKVVKKAAEGVLDEFEYKGLTIREWADKIASGEYQPVKRGRWIDSWICSECKGGSREPNTPYCPNCGAKMDGGYEE
jgi:rubrerythrin